MNNNKFWIGEVEFYSEAHFLDSFNPRLRLDHEIIEERNQLALASRAKVHLGILNASISDDFDKKVKEMSVYDIKGIEENLWKMLCIINSGLAVLELYTIVGEGRTSYSIQEMLDTSFMINANGQMLTVVYWWAHLNGMKLEGDSDPYKMKTVVICYLLSHLYFALKNFTYGQNEIHLVNPKPGQSTYVYEVVNTLELIELIVKAIECVMSFILSKIRNSSFEGCEGVTDMLNYLRKTFKNPFCVDADTVSVCTVGTTKVYGIFENGITNMVV